MTGDYSWCSSFTKVKYGGDFAFEDNSKGNIIGVGNVGKNYCTTIDNVCLVDNLKHNLFSISKLYDKSSKVIFDKIKMSY